MRLTEEDHAKVSAAIAAAEAQSDGEIIAAVTDTSDSYHDVALHWAVLVLLAVLAWAAIARGASNGGSTCSSAAGVPKRRRANC